MPDSVKKKVLVTGASGQLGRRLLPRLIETGYVVRAHYRSEERAAKYRPPGAVSEIGDMLEPSWLPGAVSGCHFVIHCAAMVSMRPGSRELMTKINVDGTKAVIDACKRAGVKRLIYVSSIITVGGSEDGRSLDETAPFNLGRYRIPYIDTKREAERIALEANDSALEVVVVNPAIMISVPDRELTEKDLKKIPRWVPAYFDFGINLVETDDVVRGIIAAIDKGRPGERYLLTGENLDPQTAFDLAHEFFGIHRPWIRIPVWMLYPIAPGFEVAARLRKKRPKFHRGLARVARLRFVYSCEKARQELGYAPAPLRETLLRIVPSVRRGRPDIP